MAIVACLLGGILSAPQEAFADPAVFAPTATTPDAPARTGTPTLPEAVLPPMWNLDGLYLWLGPTGAASRIQSQWDSTFGADLTVVRVREREPLGAIGASFSATRWTVRGGGRLSLDALAGTRLGRMVGVSLGPIVELSDLAHPRLGASVGVWGFVGLTPFARVGVVEQLGAFAEVGVHIALPIIRR
ncbi:MAG: hypothetical protein JWO36_2630 [Myxococcales bacterium]|nr:hypothetical protein [Myxococcales bacterium]